MRAEGAECADSDKRCAVCGEGAAGADGAVCATVAAVCADGAVCATMAAVCAGALSALWGTIRIIKKSLFFENDRL